VPYRRSAQSDLSARRTEVWDILEEVTTGHSGSAEPARRRAPSFRAGVRSDPDEGEAIRIHPLVCTGITADLTATRWPGMAVVGRGANGSGMLK